MRQQADKTGHPQPFAFTRADELVEHDLCTIGKVAKLRFPQDQRVGFSQRIAVFETQHCVFRQHGIDHFVPFLALTDVVQRIVTFFRVLIDEAGMTLRKRAARAVLTG